MKISKRLRTIAEFIPNGSKVIDVGCDHALLCIYLSLEKNCTSIATDINRHSISQAKYNIGRFNAKNITTIRTDGLEGVEVHEDDILVISGLGASTIQSILKDKELPNTLIISSQNDRDKLRHSVVSMGYMIKDEKYIIDNGKYYIIIMFVKGSSEYDENDYNYGPILKQNRVYLEDKIKQFTEIMSNIDSTNEEYKEFEQKIKGVKELLEKST